MNGFGVLLRKELREQLRSYRLLIFGVVALAFGMLSPLTAKYLPELIKRAGGPIQVILPPPTAADAVDQMIKNLGGQVGMFGAILLAMGMVAREKERGTAALVLTKPAGRGAFLLAKFGALTLTLGTGLLAGGLAAYGYTALLFEALPLGGYLTCLLLLLLSCMVYAALTLLGSTLVRSSLPAAGLGIAGMIAFALLGALPGLAPFTPGTLQLSARALALGQTPEELALPLVSCLVLIALLLGLAWRAFRRQEL
jgi:ABC-2 type transport system permease protein